MSLMRAVWERLMAAGGRLYHEERDDYVRLVDEKRQLAEGIAAGRIRPDDRRLDPIRSRIKDGGLPR